MFRRIASSKRLPFWLYWRMFNIWPAIRGTGGRITHATPDWSEIDVKLRLNWRTSNYVGTIFGGSIYASVDPFHMVMMLRRLGDDYVVWDKTGRVSFKQPGTETLYAKFRLTDEEVADVRAIVDRDNKLERTYSIDLKSADGRVFATVDKTLFIARKDWFKARQERRAQRKTAG